MWKLKWWKKDQYDFKSSVEETLGCLQQLGAYNAGSHHTRYMIKKYRFGSLDQLDDIKAELAGGSVLIMNASEVLGNQNVSALDFKRTIDQIRAFLKVNGGSIGRIGDNYLIMTPNGHIKISS